MRIFVRGDLSNVDITGTLNKVLRKDGNGRPHVVQVLSDSGGEIEVRATAKGFEYLEYAPAD